MRKNRRRMKMINNSNNKMKMCNNSNMIINSKTKIKVELVFEEDGSPVNFLLNSLKGYLNLLRFIWFLCICKQSMKFIYFPV